ncbi:MAG: T9SS type A sorting domain-containing protein [Salibacteraceae bacterium]|nr:T9SS type A sorting domain-containing protein [Salibacteraceae bacterium]
MIKKTSVCLLSLFLCFSYLSEAQEVNFSNGYYLDSKANLFETNDSSLTLFSINVFQLDQDLHGINVINYSSGSLSSESTQLNDGSFLYSLPGDVILKINSDLSASWKTKIDSFSVYSLATISEQKSYFVGKSTKANASYKLIIGEIDNIGQIVNSIALNLDSKPWNAEINTMSDSSIILGISESLDQGLIHHFVKLDTAFDLVWHKKFNANTWKIHSISTLQNGSFITSFSAAERDILLMKIDGDGELLWSNKIGSPKAEKLTDIDIFPNGNILIGGTSALLSSDTICDGMYTYEFCSDPMISLLDSNANVLWTNIDHSEDFDVLNGVHAFNDDSTFLVSINRPSGTLQLMKKTIADHSFCNGEDVSFTTTPFPIVFDSSGITSNTVSLSFSLSSNQSSIYPFETFLSCFPAGLSAEQWSESELKIFPNPASIEISLESPFKNAQASIIDVRGTILKSLSSLSFGNNQINIESLPSGLYIIHLLGDDGQQKTAKLLVE